MPVVAPIPSDGDEAAVAVLARAFRDNPLDVAVIGGSEPERLRSVGWGMRSTLGASRRSELAVVLGAWDRPEPGLPLGALLGVLVALPSHAIPLPPPPLLHQLRCTFGQGFGALRRWGQVLRVLERHQPREPHWYLSLIGVDPPHWGRGIGGRLLEAWLGSIESDGLPTWLETDRESNLAFYERAGFAVESRHQILGTAVWCMRRPAPVPAARTAPWSAALSGARP